VRVALVGGGVQPIPPTGYGAIERIVAELATALRAAGHEAVIVNRVRRGRMRDEYPFARELPRLLAAERFDVVHAHTPVVANRLAGRGYRYAYTSHSRHWFYRERLTHRWGYYLERRAVRRAGAVLALTPRLERTMRAVVRPPLPPISVVPFGVDADAFAPDWSRRSGTRALGVGVIAPFKRWDLAARALRGTGITLRLAGPIASAAYAQTVRSAGDGVELLGEVDDGRLRSLFAESDLLMHPSAVEVLSATVLEGLAAGLPVLGGPALDGVVEHGSTGYLVPDGDPTAAVVAYRRYARELVGDPGRRRAMGERARAVARDRYAWPAIAEAHLAVYGTLGPGAPRRP